MEEAKDYEVVPNPHMKGKLIRLKNNPILLADFFYAPVKSLENFEIRDDDVFVIGFPKSGNTWIEEIAYLIVNNNDFEKAKSEKITKRAPFLESWTETVESFKNLQSPRVFKSHLGLGVLTRIFETKAKVIYCIRDPKDALVSWYYYIKEFKMLDFSGTFEEFIQYAMDDKVICGPWWVHVNQYYKLPNKHIVFYEDMIKDPFGEIKKLCKYLGKECDDETINRLVEYTSFENFKNNPTINFNRYDNAFKHDKVYCRKGIVGDWKNHFSKELAEKFNKLVVEKLEFDFDRYFKVEMD